VYYDLLSLHSEICQVFLELPVYIVANYHAEHMIQLLLTLDRLTLDVSHSLRKHIILNHITLDRREDLFVKSLV